MIVKGSDIFYNDTNGDSERVMRKGRGLVNG